MYFVITHEIIEAWFMAQEPAPRAYMTKVGAGCNVGCITKEKQGGY